MAPTGYPLIIPITNANAPSPGTLKTGFINLVKSFPKKETTKVWESKSVATKKQNKEGITELAHNAKPDLAASKLDFEKNIKDRVKIIRKNPKK